MAPFSVLFAEFTLANFACSKAHFAFGPDAFKARGSFFPEFLPRQPGCLVTAPCHLQMSLETLVKTNALVSLCDTTCHQPLAWLICT